VHQPADSFLITLAPLPIQTLTSAEHQWDWSFHLSLLSNDRLEYSKALNSTTTTALSNTRKFWH